MSFRWNLLTSAATMGKRGHATLVLFIRGQPARLAATGTGAFRQPIAQIGARLFRRGFELLHNFRMLRGNVGGFADVVDEVVKLGGFNLFVHIISRHTVASGFLAKHGPVSRSEEHTSELQS